jgi:energy-coupling factor transport system ATP-binding protein
VKIEIQDLHFTYPGDVHALRGVNLTIASGEILAWVGENGAGKTTLAKLLNGLLQPSAGFIRIGDLDTRQATSAALARSVGYAFQNPDEQLFLNTVWKEVAFGPSNLLKDPNLVEVRTRTALDVVGLLELAQHHPYDLLPAQRKLLGIASILSMQNPIMILDEPTMGLDQRGTDTLTGILEAARLQHQTVIIISHDMDFCLEQVQRFIIFSEGRILHQGPADSVFDDYSRLERAGLEQPQLVRLAKALALPRVPTNPQEFLDLLPEGRRSA